MRHSEEFCRVFLEKSGEGVCCIELEKAIPVSLSKDEQAKRLIDFGYLADCNPAMAHMHGHATTDDMTGLRAADLLNLSSHKNRPVLTSFIESGHRQVNAQFHTRDPKGKEHVFLADLLGVIEEGDLIRIWVIQREGTRPAGTEHVARQSERRFQQVAENAEEWIWEVDTAGLYTYASPVVEKILGYSPAEIVGKKHFYDLFHPEEREALKDTALAAFSGKTPFRRFVNRNVHKDGSTVWLSTSGVPVLNEDGTLTGYRGLDLNITDEKQAQDELLNEKTRLESLIHHGLLAIVALDDSHRCVSCNRRFEELFQFTEEEILGKDLDAFILNPDNLQDGLNYTRQVLRGEQVHGSGKRQRKDGSTFDAEVLGVPIIIDGRVIGAYGIYQDVSERKRTTEALKESGRRFREFAQLLPEIVCETDEKGTIVFTNQKALATFGYTEAELEEGLTVFQMLIPEDRDRAARNIGRTLKGEKSESAEYSALRKDGTTFPVLIYANTILRGGKGAGLRAIVTDITERKRMEEGLRKSEEKYRNLVENLNDVIYVVDSEGAIIYVSPAVERVTKYRAEEIIGQPFVSLVHPGDLPDLTASFERTLQGQLEAHEFRLFDKDGTVRHVRTSSRRLFEKDEPRGLTGVITDLTEHKAMEEELLNAKKLESIAVLSGGIAHDFNNLLTAILGYIELAEESLDDVVTLKPHLSEAQNAGLRARDLVRQFSAFAKEGAPERTTASIIRTIKDTADLALAGSNVRAEYSIPEDLWPVHFNEGQIAQVISTLIINAREAMPQGGVVEVSAENVTIGTNLQEPRNPLVPANHIRVMITDHGIGIPEHHLPNIFDPYFSTKKRGVQKGMGLGLSIAYSIIKKHGGRIDIKSILGSGTTVNLCLPASSQAVPETEAMNGKPASQACKVLLMDDEEMIREVASEMLTLIGSRVELATDGAEAIQLFKEARDKGEPFDLVLLDLVIKDGMGGQETIQELRRIAPDVKGIASSGYHDDPIMKDPAAYGFSGSIPKPYQLDELRKAVREATSRDRRREVTS